MEKLVLEKQVFKKLFKKIILSFFVLTFFSAVGLCAGPRRNGLIRKKRARMTRILESKSQSEGAFYDHIASKAGDPNELIRTINTFSVGCRCGGCSLLIFVLFKRLEMFSWIMDLIPEGRRMEVLDYQNDSKPCLLGFFVRGFYVSEGNNLDRSFNLILDYVPEQDRASFIQSSIDQLNACMEGFPRYQETAEDEDFDKQIAAIKSSIQYLETKLARLSFE
jgi:hypothetical protein